MVQYPRTYPWVSRLQRLSAVFTANSTIRRHSLLIPCLAEENICFAAALFLCKHGIIPTACPWISRLQCLSATTIYFVIIHYHNRRKFFMNENNGIIRNASVLGVPKMLLLGLQHMFAMFGATILVPILVNS